VGGGGGGGGGGPVQDRWEGMCPCHHVRNLLS